MRLWSKLFCAATMLLLPWQAAAVEVQEVQTNGITAWLVEDYSVPVVSVMVAFRDAGSASDTEDTQGRAAMVAGLLDEGAGELSAKAYQQQLDSHAIDVSFDVSDDLLSASTYSLADKSEEAFRLLGLALTDPRFDEAALTRVKNQMISLQQILQQKPDYVAGQKWRELAYPEHPYRFARYGTQQTVEALTREQLTAFQSRYLSKRNMIIGVSGAISAQQLKQYMQAYFDTLPEAFLPEKRIMPTEMAAGPIAQHVEKESAQTSVLLGMPSVPRDHPDFYAVYLLNQAIGGGGLTSLLSQTVREDEGLTYGIYSRLDVDLHSSSWRGAFSTRPENADKAIALVRKTLLAVKQKGIDAQTFNDVKAYVTGSFPLNLDSTGGIAGYLVSMQLYALGQDYLQKRNSYFEAVTVQDVNRVADYLLQHIDNSVLVTVGPTSAEEGVTQP